MDQEGRLASEFVGRKSQSRVKRIAAMSATCSLDCKEGLAEKKFVCVCVCLFVCLWRSKEPQKFIFHQNSFSEVFRYGENDFEYYCAGDRIRGGHVTHPYFRGQRNIENLFFAKILFLRFFDTGNTNSSITELGTVSGVVM